MLRPVHITFRGMSPSPSVEQAVHGWVARLEHSYGRIQSCAVVIELPHRHQRHGNAFHVHVDVRVPGREIAVSREPGRGAHWDVYIAVADAFRAARRQLVDHARIRRGEVKRHVA
ncbi:MAG TPA: HPF/RaiA family ribosome-associated protein [Kofleriaceae bacterium]|nr:HPF/RaiA family ribosome-associated protein [Kofleriaceae bacterium]